MGLCQNRRLLPKDSAVPDYELPDAAGTRAMAAFGWGSEDVEMQVLAMVKTGGEATHCMGADAPLAADSEVMSQLGKLAAAESRREKTGGKVAARPKWAMTEEAAAVVHASEQLGLELEQARESKAAMEESKVQQIGRASCRERV